MKIICFKPQLYLYWTNGHTSEKSWRLYNYHWGIVTDEFWNDIKAWQSMFKTKPSPVQSYLKTQILINAEPLTQEQIDYVTEYYKDDLLKWQELQTRGIFGYNLVGEFIAKKPKIFGEHKYVRCAAVCGEEHVQLISFKWFLIIQWFKIKKIYLNWKQKQYYKKNPFEHYYGK